LYCRMRLLLLCALAPVCLALTVESSDAKEGEPDRFGMIKSKPSAAYSASLVLVSAATAAQMITPGWLQGVLGPAAGSGLGKVALQCAGFLQTQTKQHPLGMVLAHGIVTKACADVLAQTIPQGDAPVIWLDPLRILRSTTASVISTSMPFYYWTKFMPTFFTAIQTWLNGAIAMPFLRGFVSAFLKTTITQVVFRPWNVGGFLLLQSAFRGDTARQLVSVMRKKFKQSLAGGILFYSISNLLMYSVPIPFLHPIMGSIAGLMFNVWLAMVAYGKSSKA